MIKKRTYLLIILMLSSYVSVISQCIADFEAVLDSNSTIPYRYKFYDQSSGDPNSWYWDFGDGNTSNKQNPVHTFKAEGSYTVCLEISDNNPGCSDTICKSLRTPEYHNLGGFAYAGEVPINNPFNTGDTGIACIFRKISGNRIVPMDTIRFDTLGYYWFSNLLAAEYIIKVELTAYSNHYKQFLPTYHMDKSIWQDANTIAIKDNNLFEVHTYLRYIPGAEEGPGKIRGKVTSEIFPFNNTRHSAHPVEVILMNSNKEPLEYTYTNPSGHFSFSFLRLGTYWLYPEYPGTYAAPLKVVVNEDNPVIDTINLTIYEYNITSTPEYPYTDETKLSKVYPNPVITEAMLNISLNRAERINFMIFDIYGNLVYAAEESFHSGRHVISIPVETLATGLYLLSVRSEDGLIEKHRKFIK